MLLKNMLPEDNTLPKNHYEAKKISCPMCIEYSKIHACPNDCILYINHYVEMRKCPTCRVSWYKVNDDGTSDDATTSNKCLAKVCWYLPIIPSLSDYLLMHMMQKT